jgi:hypothetical protein
MEKRPIWRLKNAVRNEPKTQAGVHFGGMVPRGGLQESGIIKGLTRGGTLKLLPAFFTFPHDGVPPKRLSNIRNSAPATTTVFVPDPDGLKLEVVQLNRMTVGAAFSAKEIEMGGHLLSSTDGRDQGDAGAQQ